LIRNQINKMSFSYLTFKNLGITLLILFRTLFAIFWLAAGINKVESEWMTSNILEVVFLQRLTELPPDSFAVLYLSNFAIPLHQLIGSIVTLGELYSAIGLMVGLTTRCSAAVSLFIIFNFAIGGYYDASLLPFFILIFLFLWFPTGQWFGLDRYLGKKYPNQIIFK